MAFINFIPGVWEEGILRDSDRKCVFVADCNRRYEGKVKEKGESVTILGVGRPTIRTLASSTATITAAELIEDTSIIMYINQRKYYNYLIPDIDKAQAVPAVTEAYRKVTAEALANDQDRYVASKVADAAKVYAADQLVAATASETAVSVLKALDLARQKMYENDVPSTAKIIATLSPRYYMMFLDAYTGRDTDNSDAMANGALGKYNGMYIKMSNNVYTTGSGAANGLGGAVDNIMVRTEEAVAFANPFFESEALRSASAFSDEIRGLTLYDAKIVRPKEILNLNVKYA